MAKKKKIKSKSFSEYNYIQKQLSSYLKKEGIKPSKKFSSFASSIYKNAKQKGLKRAFIKKNIASLYNSLFELSPIEKASLEEKEYFPDRFAFFNFLNQLTLPVFEGVEITIEFEDLHTEKITQTGFRADIEEWYLRNLHKYLRDHYNDSPVAEFVLMGNKIVSNGEVFYKIETGQKYDDRSLPSENKIKDGKKNVSEVNALLELEREKQRTIDKKMQAVKELSDRGWTQEEIKKFLGI